MKYQRQTGDSGDSGVSGYPHACTRTHARSIATRAHAHAEAAQELPIPPNPPEPPDVILARADLDPASVLDSFALVARAADYAKPTDAVLRALEDALRTHCEAIRATWSRATLRYRYVASRRRKAARFTRGVKSRRR